MTSVVQRSRTWLFLGLMAASASCASADDSRKLLAFFFDGVEEEEQARLAALRLAESRRQVAAAAPHEGRRAPGFTGSIHAPYGNRACQLCHPGGRQAGVAVRSADLCLDCHDMAEYSGVFAHAPTREGKCTACHSPHESKQRHLVRRPQRELCGECHAPDAPGFARWHVELADDAECSLCHDPHGEDDAKLLVVFDAQRCGACHAAQVDPRSANHAPINAGRCDDCHRSDHLGAKPYLVDRAETLCFNCHGAETLSGGEMHQTTSTWRCTDCHNPHGPTPVNAGRRTSPEVGAPTSPTPPASAPAPPASAPAPPASAPAPPAPAPPSPAPPTGAP